MCRRAHYGGGEHPRPREKALVSQPDAATETADAPAPTPFHRLADYAAIPRVGGLALSRGGRLGIAVQPLAAEKKKWVSALWEVDPEGRRPAHRLTRSAPGESSPAWAPDGSLLFTSARPDPEAAADKNGEPKPALWALPPGGGEARLVLARSGGVSGFAVAADSTGRCWPASAASSPTTAASAAPSSTPTAARRPRSWGRRWTAGSSPTSATPAAVPGTATPATTAPSARCSSSRRPGAPIRWTATG